MTSSDGRIGRPRDPNVDKAVLRAAITILAQKGYAELTMNGVVAMSGVAKTSIYRRWPSKHELTLDAIALQLGDRPLPNSGDVIQDIHELVTQLYQSMGESVGGRALPAISVELLREPDLAAAYRRRFVEPLREHGVKLINKGMAEGIFRSGLDPEAFIDAVAAAAIYRPLAVGQPAGTAHGLAILELVLDGARSDQPARSPLPSGTAGG